MFGQDSGATLTEEVLLHNDDAFLGLDFMEEIAVGALQKPIFALPSISNSSEFIATSV